MLHFYTYQYSQRVRTIIKMSLIIMLTSFFVYSKPASYSDEYLMQKKMYDSMSSVSMINGKYIIDTSFIDADRNRERLLADLKSEELVRKTTKEEIPPFIVAFLDSTSVNKKFEMANPWENWRTGDIMDLVLTSCDVIEDRARFSVSSEPKKELPDKRLIYFGISENMALLSYHSGGIRLQQHVVIMKFKNNKIVDLWFNECFGLYAKTRLEILENIDRLGNKGRGC